MQWDIKKNANQKNAMQWDIKKNASNSRDNFLASHIARALQNDIHQNDSQQNDSQ